MPRLSNSLPKYRKHRPSGRALVTLNGRDFYLGEYGTKTSKLEYDRLVSEWMANGRNLAMGQSVDLTVAELLFRYWKYAKGYYRKNGEPTSEIGAIKSALRPVRELYGNQLARDFGPLALETVRQRMISLGRSRTGINRAISRVKRVFRWGVCKELLPPAIAQALSTVDGLRKDRSEAPERPPVAPVSDAAVQEITERLPTVVADMVRLQRLTGMRPGEVCSLRPCDIDRSSEVWEYHPGSHKTEHRGRERIIFIGPKAQAILLRYLARDPSMHCFRPCDSEEKRRAKAHADRKTPLSCGNRPGSSRKRNPKRSAGECYTPASYRRAINRACDKAFPHPKLGYKMRSKFTDAQVQELRQWQSEHHWSPNQLRHTAASEIRKEHGLEAAQVILGHSQANVTQVYAERDMAKGIEVAKLIG